MQPEIISFDDLFYSAKDIAFSKLKRALFEQGIVGIRNVPDFQKTYHTFIKTAQAFSALDEKTKQKYTPNRDANDTEGYELGAEWFKDPKGNWLIDDKKASYYAFIPDHPRNKWPTEIDLKTPYLNLGQLIFETGKHLLNLLGLNDLIGIRPDDLLGYGRMLHYQKENETTYANPNWCGAHFDHGIFTGLAPACYFKEGKEIEEPEESGLFITPTNSKDFIKMISSDKSILLFQVGEFGQLASHDAICATKHLVKKAKGNIERFTFALFFSAKDNISIQSKSELTKDRRYVDNMEINGSLSYKKWHEASLERYLASKDPRFRGDDEVRGGDNEVNRETIR